MTVVGADRSAVSTVRRDGARLVFAGALDRAACAGLWQEVRTISTRRPDQQAVLDLSAVTRVDSAGLALLAEIASHSPGMAVIGSPVGLSELRAAYRLDDSLGFAS